MTFTTRFRCLLVGAALCWSLTLAIAGGSGVGGDDGGMSLDDLYTSHIQHNFEISCDSLGTLGLSTGTIPAPRIHDLPFLINDSGDTVWLQPGPGIGSLRIEYAASPAIFNCGAEYTVVRTYTLRDTCRPLDIRTYTQAWRITDRSPPTLTMPITTEEPPVVGTNTPGECAARVRLDRPESTLTDACGGPLNLQAAVFEINRPGFPLLEARSINLEDATEDRAEPLPPGDYFIRYEFSDECGNAGSLDWPFRIKDTTGPAARCNPGIIFELPPGADEQTLRTLTVSQFNMGSRDACGGSVLASIARVRLTDDGEVEPVAGEGYADSVQLTCADYGTTLIGLRTEDERGNVSFCSETVELSGGPEACAPPPGVTITAARFDTLGLNDDLGVMSEERLDELFGRAATNGLCYLTLSQTVAGERDACGAATYVRTFQLGNPAGIGPVPACQQTIEVVDVPKYSIRFPADRGADCGALFGPDEVVITGPSANDFVVSISTQRLESASDHCYELALTYRVTNTCETRPSGALPIEIPRDVDSDGLDDEATYLHLLPGDELLAADDRAVLDVDEDPENGSFNPPALAEYGQSERRGDFVYTQYIRISDDMAPEIAVDAPATCLGLEGQDCLGYLQMDFALTDDCTQPGGFTAIAELDEAYDGEGFVRSRFLLPEEIWAAPDGRHQLELYGISVGAHALRITGADECGNVTSRVVEFCVDEAAAARVACPEVVAVLLNRGERRTNPQGLWADELSLHPPDLCADGLQYSIYKGHEAEAVGFEPAPGREAVLYDCDSPQEGSVRVYAFNSLGHQAYCTTEVLVAHGEGACLAGVDGNIQGRVFSPDGFPIPEVRIRVEGEGLDRRSLSGVDGLYVVDSLSLGQNYRVEAYLDDYSKHGRGVSSSDLVVVARHILGLQAITDPYRYLAADANSDYRITIRDLIAIRRLILALDRVYAEAPAYRFVPADYVFPVPGNPYATSFPQEIKVRNLTGSYERADFIGIMVGDASGNAFSGLMAGEAAREVGPSLVVDEVVLPAGVVTEVLVYPGELAGWEGVQGTLRAGPGVELLGVRALAVPPLAMSEAFLGGGLLSFAHVAVEGLRGAEPLLAVSLLAERDLPLREGLLLTDHVTVAEASHGGRVVRPYLRYRAVEGVSVEGLAAYPNPVLRATTLMVPAGCSRVFIYNVQGREVARARVQGSGPGEVITLARSVFPGPGLYIVRTDAGGVLRLIVQ